jgi:hypothetical protein
MLVAAACAAMEKENRAMMTTMTREALVTVVERYFEGLRTKDLSRVPFATDVSFESPLSPRMTGQDVAAFLAGVFPIVKDVRVKQHIVEGEYVATLFDFETIYGTIPAFDCFRVVDGQIAQIRPYFDPRPITEAQTG